jgi:hypothetical protein
MGEVTSMNASGCERAIVERLEAFDHSMYPERAADHVLRLQLDP